LKITISFIKSILVPNVMHNIHIKQIGIRSINVRRCGDIYLHTDNQIPLDLHLDLPSSLLVPMKSSFAQTLLPLVIVYSTPLTPLVSCHPREAIRRISHKLGVNMIRTLELNGITLFTASDNRIRRW
jgi:hypothetical protein